MSAHQHHHGEDRPIVAAARGQPPGTLFPRGGDVHGAVAAAVPSIRPAIAQLRAAPTTALQPEVYLIGCGGDLAVDGDASAQTMGFKAWNLLRMAQLALPVPAAFVIGTHYCADA